jgi:serine/threonine-protein kinase
MADILAAQGKDTECESVLLNCVRLHPDFAPAYNSLAELQMRQGRVHEAANVLSGALRRWPNDAVLLNNLGMCSLIRRDYEKALGYFTQAAAHAPRSEKYRANMATSLGMLGRDAEALALLRQILPEREAVHNADVLRRAREKAADASVNVSPG